MAKCKKLEIRVVKRELNARANALKKRKQLKGIYNKVQDVHHNIFSKKFEASMDSKGKHDQNNE